MSARPGPSVEDVREVRRVVARLVRRKRLARAAWWGTWGAALGGGIAVVLALAAHLAPLMDRSRMVALAGLALLVCTAGAALLAALWRVNARRLLVGAEVVLGLRSRLSTALELGGSKGRAELVLGSVRPLVREQARDAAASARSTDWRRAVPLQAPRLALFLIPALLACFLGVLFSPDPQAAVLAEKREVAAAQKKEAETVRKASTKLQKKAAKQDAATKKALAELDALRKDLARGSLKREEATARLSKTEAAIQEASQAGPAKSRAALQKAVSSLAANPSTTALADAAAKGDAAETKKQAAKLAQQMSEMTPEQRARTRQAMRAASAATSALSPQLSQALSDASSGSPQGAQSLASQLQAAQADAQTAQAMEGVLSQLQDSKSQIASAGQVPRNIARAAGTPGPPVQLTPGPAFSGTPQPGGTPGSGQGSGQGQGQGQGSGQGQGAGQGSGQGAGQGQGQGNVGSTNGGGGMHGDAQGGKGKGGANGQGEAKGGNDGREATDEFEPLYAPSKVDKDGNLVQVRGRDLGGRTKEKELGPGQGQENTPTRPYGEAYADYSGAATNYLDEHYIPITQKDLVREYFAGIAPEEGGK